MLELDLILMRFVENYFEVLSETQLDAFDSLLSCSDPELFGWLMGYEHPKDKELASIVEFIQLHDRI